MDLEAPQSGVEDRSQWRALAVQFVLSCVIGGAVLLALSPYPENPKVPLFGGLLAGFFGMRTVVFLCVWARYGWGAARSMRMG